MLLRAVFAACMLLCLMASAYSTAEYEQFKRHELRQVSYVGIAGAIWSAFMLVFW